ncbi:MAG: YARHG domain-containing protein [Bacteroidota bacterium]
MRSLPFLQLIILCFLTTACGEKATSPDQSEDFGSEASTSGSTNTTDQENATGTATAPLEEASSPSFMPLEGATYAFNHEDVLAAADLSEYNLDDLAMMRNEIYAHYGYQFKNANWATHFAAAGFPATDDYIDDQLTATDKANIEMIVLAESQLRHAQQEAETAVDTPVAIQLKDIEEEGNISARFRLFLQDWLQSAFMENEEYIESTLYPGFEMASTEMILREFGQKEFGDEMSTVTYSVAHCAFDHCDWCGEELGVEATGERYHFSKLWNTEDPEAIRDGWMLGFYFVEVEDGFQIYCMSAAG